MSNTTINILLVIWIISALGIFAFILHALYLRKKWLHEVEILFRGYDLMSTFLYFSILACVQYGGAFTSHFLAKRTKMLKAREVVPENIQIHFIISFWLLMVSTVLFFSVGYIISDSIKTG